MAAGHRDFCHGRLFEPCCPKLCGAVAPRGHWQVRRRFVGDGLALPACLDGVSTVCSLCRTWSLACWCCVSLCAVGTLCPPLVLVPIPRRPLAAHDTLGFTRTAVSSSSSSSDGSTLSSARMRARTLTRTCSPARAHSPGKCADIDVGRPPQPHHHSRPAQISQTSAA